MGVREAWYCDDHRCDARAEVDQDDGPPEGWGLNIESDVFCPKHAALLDPPDEDDD